MKKILILIFIIFIYTFYSQQETKESYASPSLAKENAVTTINKISEKEEIAPEDTLEKKDSYFNNLNPIFLSGFFIILGSIVGALIASLTNIYYLRSRRNEEYKSLLIGFCVELVSAFERCVEYYERTYSERRHCYSVLFEFTDAQTFSKFASACKDPEILVAIMELKSNYFQISRYTVEASKYSVQKHQIKRFSELGELEDFPLLFFSGNEEENEKEIKRLDRLATISWDIVMAFFEYSYKSLEENTVKIIEKAKKEAPREVINDLYTKFNTAKNTKREIDENLRRKLKKLTKEVIERTRSKFKNKKEKGSENNQKEEN